MIIALSVFAQDVAADQQMACYSTWGAAVRHVETGITFRALARDSAGYDMKADAAAPFVRGGFYIGSGTWDQNARLMRATLTDHDGEISTAVEDSVTGLTKGHLFTHIGAAAGHDGPEPISYFHGRIAELIVFNRLLTDKEQSDVRAYLHNRHILGTQDNHPLPVTGGLIVRLDAASLNPDAAIWSDLSGHHNDAACVNGEPVLQADATPTGGPAVLFDGGVCFKIDSRPEDFDSHGYSWFVVFSTDSPEAGPLFSSGYADIARPLIAVDPGIQRMRYNNSGLEVDLGVGLWANPLPMDLDADGKPELYVASTGKPDNGIYLFKRAAAEDNCTLFSPGEIVAWSTHNLRASRTHDGRWVLLSPGRLYDRFARDGLSTWKQIDYTPTFHISRANQWSLFDYDGDGVDDLIIGADDWREYGWDDAFNAEGQWTNGPLRGFVWWIRNTGTNSDPVYEEARPVLADGVPVETYGNPTPNFADFNGDGLPDLICGEFLDRLTFFANVGTRTEPVFAAGRFLEHDGAVIHMDAQMILPTAIDWDVDGRTDLIVGEDDGAVTLLRNSGDTRDGVPVFDQPQKLYQVADEIKVGALCTPSATDWDGDGDTDLIVGDAAGFVSFLENLGGEPTRWAGPVKLKADGNTIRILAGENGSIQGPAEAKWGYFVAETADWDHDGLTDLLVNDIGGRIRWYRNIGTKTEPRLTSPQPVKVRWDGAQRYPAWNWWKPAPGEFVTQWRSSIQAIDLNHDGLLDLVALDEDGYLALFERQMTDGGLVLTPGRRIFHMQTGTPSAFNQLHEPMAFDLNADGVNDLTVLDDNGRLPFYHRKITFNTRTLGVPGTSCDRHDDARYLDGDNATALRLNAGWAGRSGRRKFVLTDWDHDGRLDLIVNSVSCNFLKNVSTDPNRFVFVDMGPVTPKVLAGHTTCPEILATQEGEGRLIIGAEDGYLYTLTP
jgi:hypothetical protein